MDSPFFVNANLHQVMHFSSLEATKLAADIERLAHD